jgi:hypothetical protein
MKRQRVIVLLLIASLLTGCFLARSGAVQISLELQGTLGETQEVMITNQSRTYLIDLGSDTICAFSLASGSWWVQAFSRDAEGRVFSASELVRVSGRAEAFVVSGANTSPSPDHRNQTAQRGSYLAAGRWDGVDMGM